MGDTADSGVGCSTGLPVRQATKAEGGALGQPYARVGYTPQSGTKNVATGVTVHIHKTEGAWYLSFF